MVALGQRKTLAKFEENQPIDLGNGRKQDNYVELLTSWGRLRKITGRRGLEALQGQLIGKWELTTAFHSALENKVWKSMRIVASNNRVFTVESIELQDEENRRDYVFILNEKSNA
jgi:hypothetical protein